MARIPRVYLVTSERPGDVAEQRRYFTPEAATERERMMREARPDATVTVTPSHPIAYPSEADPQRFDLPDSMVSRQHLHDLIDTMGIQPEAVRSLTITTDTVLVEYQPDPKRDRTPRTWRVAIID